MYTDCVIANTKQLLSPQSSHCYTHPHHQMSTQEFAARGRWTLLGKHVFVGGARMNWMYQMNWYNNEHQSRRHLGSGLHQVERAILEDIFWPIVKYTEYVLRALQKQTSGSRCHLACGLVGTEESLTDGVCTGATWQIRWTASCEL